MFCGENYWVCRVVFGIMSIQVYFMHELVHFQSTTTHVHNDQTSRIPLAKLGVTYPENVRVSARGRHRAPPRHPIQVSPLEQADKKISALRDDLKTL
ncbi:hypothetical protein M378DRAFT_764565 [Amanita muscaria Koide BX008]|uniref:Uncharacterized protein n=1 Tax=Amanita muscaria (strain Koide BX008) TaxID=946122 RepID=A0A0C2SZX4_AMAMK|nr:hypothetical protein M378DRAFT_764565 [Amanita muscaria Koide BX008]